MPGLTKKDIKATVANGFLTIEAEQNDNYKIPTDINKTWKLNEHIDASKISLELKHGILTISLPKKEKSKTMSITVK